MTSKRLGIFIFLSVLLHVFLLFAYQYIEPYLPKQLPVEPSKSVKVTLVNPAKPVPPPLQPSKPVPKQPVFVDTANLKQAKEANPETPLESEKTTQASSQTVGEGSTFVPNQKGSDIPGLDLTDSKASVDNKSQPQPPSPKPDKEVAKAEPPKTQPAEKPDPKDPVDPKEQKTPPQVKPVEPVPLRPDSTIEITQAQPQESPKPSPDPVQQSQPVTENTSPRSPPPSTMSFERQRSTISGAAPMGPSQSVESRETELGKYKAKLFRGIGSRWYLYVQQDNGLLGVGNVKIRFYVRSDGVITNLEIVQGKQNAQLAAISRRSIMEISGQLEPFSESLKIQLGEGYTEEVTFSIY